MGIERARVIEVRAGTGYQVDSRLVLTSAGVVGRSESVDVRPSGSGTWVPATVVWRGDAALLEVSDPAALLPSPRPLRWGAVVGSRPVAVAALGFPPVDGGPRWIRDPEQWSGRLSADGTVRADAAAMAGAALFAGAELVGVLDGASRAVSVAAMAADDAFVDLVGGLEVVPVETPAGGFPVLP